MTTSISLMLGGDDAPSAAQWYRTALGATELWSLGSVIGLEIKGAPFFLHETTSRGFSTPIALDQTTVRVELFVDDPDAFWARAVNSGATMASTEVKNRDVPWGSHRQGTFTDPFGHV